MRSSKNDSADQEPQITGHFGGTGFKLRIIYTSA